jgi:hypothetical protein
MAPGPTEYRLLELSMENKPVDDLRHAHHDVEPHLHEVAFLLDAILTKYHGAVAKGAIILPLGSVGRRRLTGPRELDHGSRRSARVLPVEFGIATIHVVQTQNKINKAFPEVGSVSGNAGGAL